MQFTKENAENVMAKAKTQTRRAVSIDHFYHAYGGTPTVCIRLRNGKLHVKWQVGRTYAVCPGRGKPAIGRIRLLSIRKEKLQGISHEDCLAELGFTAWPDNKSLKNAYANLWDSINPKGKRWVDNPDVWALTFEVVGEGGK